MCTFHRRVGLDSYTQTRDHDANDDHGVKPERVGLKGYQSEPGVADAQRERESNRAAAAMRIESESKATGIYNGPNDEPAPYSTC